MTKQFVSENHLIQIRGIEPLFRPLTFTVNSNLFNLLNLTIKHLNLKLYHL
jgi:hypothetical protein